MLSLSGSTLINMILGKVAAGWPWAANFSLATAKLCRVAGQMSGQWVKPKKRRLQLPFSDSRVNVLPFWSFSVKSGKTIGDGRTVAYSGRAAGPVVARMNNHPPPIKAIAIRTNAVLFLAWFTDHAF